MKSGEAALFIVDIYQEYDKAVSLQEDKYLSPVFYQSENGEVIKWKFLGEYTKEIANFLEALIDLGIIQGRILRLISEERSKDEE